MSDVKKGDMGEEEVYDEDVMKQILGSPWMDNLSKLSFLHLFMFATTY